MEFIKRVWAEQFTLSDEQKAKVKANTPVEWHGENVKHNGADRFHVLLTITGTHTPIYEGQWLVKDSPNTKVMWDDQFKAEYSAVADTPAPKASQPVRSEALEAFLKKNQPTEVSPVQTEAVADTPAPEIDPSLNGQTHE